MATSKKMTLLLLFFFSATFIGCQDKEENGIIAACENTTDQAQCDDCCMGEDFDKGQYLLTTDECRCSNFD